MTLISMRAELLKIFWRGKYRALLAINAVICALVSLLGVSGVRLGSVTLALPNATFNALSLFGPFLLPLAIFMLSADLYAQELESKSIKNVLVRPVNRLSAYMAKALAILAYVAVTLAVLFVISAAFQSAAGFDAMSLAVALLSYALTLVPLAAFVATAAFFAVLIPNSSLTMFVSVLLYIACSIAGSVWSGVDAVLYTSYVGWHKMWIGQGMPPLSLISASALLLSHIAIFLIGGYLLFDRKEI
jgi:ABC-2 type transport system permease protein